MTLYKVIYANFLNPISDKKCVFLKDYAIITKRYTHGYKITKICSQKEASEFLAKKQSVECLDFGSKVFVPGFYDTHFHWVQDDVREMPKENLLDWLSNYTWPYESKFKSKTFSKNKAKEFTKKLIEVGTIGGACYGSIHEHSIHEALDNFVGDFVLGSVQMTMNSPDYLLQSEKQAQDMVRKLTKMYRNRYAHTPRFAITTDESTMSIGARAAKRHNSFIQTHLSETQNEIDFVLSIFKNRKGFEDVKSYTEIYERCGMLTDKTIMGHGIHLSNKELKTLSHYGTSIAHCPTSNASTKDFGLGSGLFDYKKTQRFKVDWSLASDIGGGPFLSMLDVMNSFVRQNQKSGHKDASYTQALYRATLSGARLLKKDHESGNFVVGKYFNAVCIGDLPRRGNLTSEEVLAKLIRKKPSQREQYRNQIESSFFHGTKLL